jgi:hypothetical protein
VIGVEAAPNPPTIGDGTDCVRAAAGNLRRRELPRHAARIAIDARRRGRAQLRDQAHAVRRAAVTERGHRAHRAAEPADVELALELSTELGTVDDELDVRRADLADRDGRIAGERDIDLSRAAVPWNATSVTFAFDRSASRRQASPRRPERA